MQVGQFIVLAKVLEQGFTEETADWVLMKAVHFYHHQQLANAGGQ